ncbi:MAG: hypothetical protein ABW167_02955 [Baekduia sp.]
MSEPDQGEDERDSDSDSDSERLRGIIEESSELTGMTAGAMVGLIGGPPGAAAGAIAGFAISKALRRIGLEVHDRLLVARQQERVGAALGVMYDDTTEALTNGRQPRIDGFFDTPPGRGQRSDADEVLEGTLRAAADANEERKLRHIAGIFPSVALREDVNTADAHWLVKTAEQLSWRQMVALSIVADPPSQRLREQALEKDGDESGEAQGRRCASPTLAEEVEDLGRLGLLGQTMTGGEIVRAGATIGSLGNYWSVPIVDWRVTAAGALLINAARLNEIDSHERDLVVDLLLDQDLAEPPRDGDD